MRRLAAAALLGCLLAPACRAGEAPSAAQLMDELMWGRGPIGGPFALTDQHGRRRSDAEFAGRLVLLYFGYTYCPDICPTDLLAMSQAVDQLGPDGSAVQPIFVTVDPERDTPAQLALYADSFHPRLLALTGTMAEIGAVARAYKAYFAKAPLAGGKAEDYLVDHTGFIYLVGRDGRYIGYFPPGTPADRLVEAIRPHLR